MELRNNKTHYLLFIGTDNIAINNIIVLSNQVFTRRQARRLVISPEEYPHVTQHRPSSPDCQTSWSNYCCTESFVDCGIAVEVEMPWHRICRAWLSQRSWVDLALALSMEKCREMGSCRAGLFWWIATRRQEVHLWRSTWARGEMGELWAVVTCCLLCFKEGACVLAGSTDLEMVDWKWKRTL